MKILMCKDATFMHRAIAAWCTHEGCDFTTDNTTDAEDHMQTSKHVRSEMKVTEFWNSGMVKAAVKFNTEKVAFKKISESWLCTCGESFKSYKKAEVHIMFPPDRKFEHYVTYIVQEVPVPLKAQKLSEEMARELV